MPFHLWTADAYQGAPTNVTAYLSVVSKGAAAFVLLTVLVKVFAPMTEQWQTLLWIVTVSSITVANLFAIRQKDLKRFMAFSSISQAGYIMLAVIGGKMAWESLRRGCGEEDEAPPDLSARRLCVLAIATSIDALAVGVSMAFMSVHILASAAVIGVVAFALSVTGGLVGRRLSCLFQRRAELTGGLVLIAIGVKILIEHLSGG